MCEILSFGFSRELVPALLCQQDGGALAIADETSADARTLHDASLRCTTCGTVYAIRGGIAEFLSHQQPLDDVMRTEVAARDSDAHDYDRQRVPSFHKEVPATLRALGSVAGRRVIEYGCGTGRLTMELLSADQLLAIDFSIESLRRLAAKAAGRQNLGLVLADASAFRTHPAYFDAALSAQVFEHVPTAARRQTFLSEINATLKPGGVLVLTAYHFDRRTRRRGRPQEGQHRSGVFFHRFTTQELRQEVDSVLRLESLYPIDITLPLESRLHLPGGVGGAVSALVSRIPGLREFGHLLLARARKRDE